MILKFDMKMRGLKVYKIGLNDGAELTLTNCTTMSNLVKIAYCAFTRTRCQVNVDTTVL